MESRAFYTRKDVNFLAKDGEIQYYPISFTKRPKDQEINCCTMA